MLKIIFFKCYFFNFSKKLKINFFKNFFIFKNLFKYIKIDEKKHKQVHLYL